MSDAYAENDAKVLRGSHFVKGVEGWPEGCKYEFLSSRVTQTEVELRFETRRPDKMFFEVSPSFGDAWIGSFECGPGGLTEVFLTKNFETLFVVAEGQGFWVPLREPDTFEVIRPYPIKEAHIVPQSDVVLFADFIRIGAYGQAGFLWQTDRLSWDGIRITEVTSTLAHGVAWDSPAKKEVEFTVDLNTGGSTGGSSPTHYGVVG